MGVYVWLTQAGERCNPIVQTFLKRETIARKDTMEEHTRRLMAAQSHPIAALAIKAMADRGAFKKAETKPSKTYIVRISSQEECGAEFCQWLREKLGYDAQIGTEPVNLVEGIEPSRVKWFLYPLWRDFCISTEQQL
jgi:hypothetical protein